MPRARENIRYMLMDERSTKQAPVPVHGNYLPRPLGISSALDKASTEFMIGKHHSERKAC